MGVAALAGLALGGLAVGSTLIARSAQNADASRAAAQQNQLAFQAQMQQQQQNATLQQQRAAIQNSTNQQQAAADATLGPKISNPMGLAPSALNSPLFDTSTLKTGRNSLLGD